MLIWHKRPCFVRIVTAHESMSGTLAISGSTSTEPVAYSVSALSPSPQRIQRKMSKSWISMSRKIPPEPLR